MSLLIARDYANANKPLWLSTSGGTITGNLVVDGGVEATTLEGQSISVLDASGNQRLSLAYDSGSSTSSIKSTLPIRFTQLGVPTGNTTFTASAAGANLDNFTLGGTLVASIGPVPTQAITSTKSIASVSTGAPSQFGVDVSYSGLSNAEYDVQATGTIFVASGVPAADDNVNFNVSIGGGQGNMSALVFPGATGTAGGFGVSGIAPMTAIGSGGAAANIYMRARLTPNASGTILGANVKATLGGGSTAVYGANLTTLDVQRVR